VLLAGNFSFLNERVDETRWKLVRRDSTLGAVLARDGTRHLVRSPIPTRPVANVRAAARPDGGWDVVFGEVPPYPPGGSRADSLVRLWHGVLDGPRWRSVDTIPIPPGGKLSSRDMSDLLRRGDTLFVGLTFYRRGGFRDVALFSLHGGRWEVEWVPVLHSGYPRIAYWDGVGPVIVSVSGTGEPMSLGNSPFLWVRGGGWRNAGRIGTYGEEIVHHPWISLAPGLDVLSWAEQPEEESQGGWQARAVFDPLDPASAILTLDSSILPMWATVQPVIVLPGVRLWVLDHVDPGTGEREIRVVRDHEGEVTLLARLPNPYLAGLNGTVPEPGHLVISGLLENKEQQLYRSLLLHFRVACEGG
jgi:hypothetical protein